MVAEQRAMIDHLTDYIQLLTTTNLHTGPTNSFAGKSMTKSQQAATSKMSVEREESPLQVEFTSIGFTLLLNKFDLYCESSGSASQACVNELVVQAIQFANNMIRDTFTALKKAVEVKPDFKLAQENVITNLLQKRVTHIDRTIVLIDEEHEF
jgi:hypothetical protein